MGSPEMIKRRRIEEEGTRMECLPREIISDILSRLPVTCLIKLQFVCKTWRSLAHDSDLVKIPINEVDPCLVFHCDYPIRNQLCFVDLSGHIEESSSSSSYMERAIVRKLKMPFWDRMAEFDVVGSCNGLLCLADSLYRDAILVYNPFTREFKELPKGVQYPEQEVVFGFGFHPGTRQYKVVKIVYYRNSCSARAARRLTYPHSAVQVLTIGIGIGSTSSWKTICKVPYQLVRRPSEALVNGRLHWVTRPRRYHPTRRIISFDLGSDQFQEVLKPDDCDVLNRCNFHLVNLRGRLSAVVNCSHGKMEIWAMKEYGVKESWAKEASIGAYLFKGLKQNVDPSVKIWNNAAANGRVVRVLCLLRNGDILLEYKGRVLVTYDPNSRKFKDFMFQGMPNCFQTVVHSGTLNWLDTKFDH